MKKSVLIFGKAQVAAFSGGISDYAIMVALTEIFHIHYTYSILISGSLGAILNFSLNRKWAFQSDIKYRHSLKNQAAKFALMIVGSVLLKSSGTFLVTNTFSTDYKISRVLVDLVVSYCFNFPLIKYWVFRKSKKDVQRNEALFV